MTQNKIRSSSQLFIDQDLDVNSKKIVDVATPTSADHAATKGYVDSILAAADALIYKGVIDASLNPNYPAADAGHTYKISVEGRIGGSLGPEVFVGDLVICLNDGILGGTHAAVGSNWNIIHSATGNMSSTAVNPLDNQITRLDGTSGEVIQNSLATIDDNGSINIPSGQSYKVNGTPIVTNATHTGDAVGSHALTVVALNGVSLASLGTGLLRNTTGTGAPTIATDTQVTGHLLTGFSAEEGTIDASDTILEAFNKLAAHALITYEPPIASGTTSQYWRGDKTWQTLNATAVGLGNVTNNAQLKIASNLSDLADVPTARTNLGLGALALLNDLSTFSTTDLSEGDNLYFTNERAQDAIGSMLDSTLVYVDSTPLLTRAAITGDISIPESSNVATLATVNSNIGTFGSATHVASVSVNAKGLVTAASAIAIQIAESQVTGLTAALATKEPTIAAGTTAQYWRGDKSWQTLNPTAVGLGNVTNDAQLKILSNLADLDDPAIARNNLSLGSMALESTSNYYTKTASDTRYLQVSNNLFDLDNLVTARSNLGVAIGVDVQAWDADLDAISAIAATSGLLKKTAANTWSLDTNTYATTAYADSLVVGLLDDRGNYDASGNVFPSTGGSGSSGAILKGDLWTVSVAGTLGGTPVTAGDVVRALVDTPGQTSSNWAIGENNFGYVALNQALADGKIYAGNAFGIGTAVTPSGDLTMTNAGVFTLASVNVNVGTFGSASQVGVFTVDAKGLITAATNTAIQITQSQVTNLVTDLSNKQPLDATLTALAAYNTTGILTQTAADTFTGRTITGTSNQISVSNGNGVSGNPTLSLPQNIHLAASPTFANLTLTGLSSGGVVFIDVGGVLASDPGRFVYDPVTHRVGIGSVGGAQLNLDAIGSSAVGVHVDNEQDMAQDLYGFSAHVAQENTAGTRNEYGAKIRAESVSGTVADSIGVWGLSNPNAKTGISAGIKGEGQTYGGYFISTGQALRIAYDVSNYAGFTISSGGDLTIAPSGGDTAITGTLAVSGVVTGSTYNGQTISSAASFTGTLNVVTGFKVNGAAASGNYLRGDGTNFISSAIQAGDIPASSAHYIQNGTSQQTSANFNIDGDGTIGDDFRVNGRIGIGAAPSYGFYVDRTSSDIYNAFLTYTYTGVSAGTKAALRNYVDVSSGSDNSGNNSAFWNSVNVPASVSANFSSSLALVGSFYEAVHRGSGTVSGMVGVNANVSNATGAGAISNFKGFRAQLTAVAGTTVTNFYGYEVDYNLTATVTSTNSYSFYSDANSQSTNDWGTYLANAKNYMAGSLGLGTTSNLEKLHINGTGMKVLLDAAAYATTKFNSQGVDWATTTTHAIIFNDGSANRPEISWLRGARTYPEFSIRQHTTADRGGSIYSGTGLVAPTETMTFYNGKVGINVNAPTWRLDVSDASGAGLRVTSSVDSQNAVLRLVTGNSPGSGTSAADIQFYDGATQSFRFLAALGNSPASARYGGFIAYQDRDGTYLPLRFFTTDAGGTQQGAIYISAGQTAGTTGFVGIGVTSPVSTLEVAASGVSATNPGVKFRAGNAGGFAQLLRLFNSGTATLSSASRISFSANRTTGGETELAYIDAIATDIGNATADGQLRFYTAADAATPTVKVTIDESGNLGVGTTAPSSLIHAAASVDAIASMRIKNSASTANTNAAAEFIIESVDSSGFFGAFHSAYGPITRYRDMFVMGANSDAGGLVFNAGGAAQIAQFYIGGTTTPLLHMEANEVGINTATPQTALHIVKNTAGALPTGIGGNVSLIVQNNDVITRNNEVVFIGGSSTGGVILNFTSDAGAYSAQGRIFYGTGNDIMTIWTAGAERIRISPTGYVGIGTTGATSKLEVVVSETDPASIASVYGAFTSTLTAGSANIVTGITGDGRINQATFNSTSTAGVRGLTGISRVSGSSGIVTGAVGVLGTVLNTGAGTITNIYNFFSNAATNSGGGVVTNHYGFYAQANTVGTNIYGFHGNIAAATNRWNLYMLGTADNYLAGDLGIGINTPVSQLDVSSATGGLATLSRNDTAVLSADPIGVLQWWNNDSSLTTQNIFANIEVQATQDITTDAAAARMIFRTTSTTAGGSPIEAMRITQTQAITFASPTGGFGYGTGAGGTVTQLTSKATGVTLSKVTGQITMHNAALAGDTTVSFTLTNTTIAATDVLLINHISGGTAGSYIINAQAAAGSATINVRNITTGSLSEAIVIGFAVIKAVTS